MEKKVVWLPYDFDTAIGINNEGSLVFSYNLEDTDHLDGGADIFNGQQSVIWKNVRAVFFNELAQMYRELRSTGALSYEKVEKAFEDHQNKWCEAIFNEDAWFKYVSPLVEEGTGAYLSMMQGSKAEQRKWWLYNRFRYIDSKYNAGDALSDLIQLRGYAKSDITVTPYADIYPSVKYGSYLVQTRGTRNVASTLACPLDNVNDTEIYIYSASQLASVGDLSGFKVGFADFSMGTKLQSIKIGDEDALYDNANLTALTLGNNVLLKTIDVRNCSGLGTGPQKTVDISGCEIIEEVYFDGTQVNGVTLPNGGFLKVLHLPGTVTNLTIQNQKSITDLTVGSYSNISTLRLENVPTIDTKAILMSVSAGARVRLIGFSWEAEDATEIEGILDLLDTMRGLDENGNNVDTAQVSGTIHTSTLTGEQMASYNARYPFLTIRADHYTSHLYYMSWDGSALIKDVACIDGVVQDTGPAEAPVRADTDRYIITGFVGWNTSMNATVAQEGYDQNVVTDRYVYAAYTYIALTYLTYKTWDGGETIKTVTYRDGVTADTPPAEAPVRTDTDRNIFTFVGWNTEQDASVAQENIDADMSADKTVYAAYSRIALTYLSYKTWDGSETIKTVTYRDGVAQGTAPDTDPVRPDTSRVSYTFVGWNSTQDASVAEEDYDASMSADKSVYAAYSRTALTYLTYATWDGTLTLKTVTCRDGVAQEGAPSPDPARADTERISYTFVGWNTSQDASEAEPGYGDNVTEDRTVYAAYSRQGITYLTYMNYDGSETLKTVTCIDGVPQDMTPPTGPARAATERIRYTFVGWNTAQDASVDEEGYLDDVIADRTVYAAYSRVALTYLTYKSYDGETTYKTVTCVSGTPEEGAPSNPSRSATAQYTYTFVGWSTSQDAQSATSGYNTNVTSDRIVYAAFSRTVNTYTVTWKDADGTVLETDTSVQYGATPTYNGVTPSYNGQTFQRWTPAVSAVTENVTYTASYIPEYTVYFYSGSTLLQTSTVQQGGTATYTGDTPTDGDKIFTGWSPSPTNVQGNLSVYAQFRANVETPTATSSDGAYGVEWDYSQTASTLTRKGLAASFSNPTPATSVSGSGSSPFDTIEPWASMKRYCVIDGSYVPDTDSRYDPTAYDALVYIPEFYYTAYKDTENSKWLWAISPTALEGYCKHPGSGRYIGRYHTGGSAVGVYSKSGVSPLVNTSQTDFRRYSAAKGNGWRMMDLAAWCALELLYLVEYANFDSQTVLGKGWSTGPLGRMGGTDSAAYHTVKATGAHNQYRWIEDPFSNCYDWIDGFVGSKSSDTYAAANDSYAGGSGDLNALGFKLPSTNEIKNFGYSESAAWAFVPCESVSNSSMFTYVCDRVDSSNSLYPAYVGGGYYGDAYCGFFYFNANSSALNTSGNLGSRLLKT